MHKDGPFIIARGWYDRGRDHIHKDGPSLSHGHWCDRGIYYIHKNGPFIIAGYTCIEEEIICIKIDHSL